MVREMARVVFAQMATVAPAAAEPAPTAVFGGWPGGTVNATKTLEVAQLLKDLGEEDQRKAGEPFCPRRFDCNIVKVKWKDEGEG